MLSDLQNHNSVLVKLAAVWHLLSLSYSDLLLLALQSTCILTSWRRHAIIARGGSMLAYNAASFVCMNESGKGRAGHFSKGRGGTASGEDCTQGAQQTARLATLLFYHCTTIL